MDEIESTYIAFKEKRGKTKAEITTGDTQIPSPGFIAETKKSLVLLALENFFSVLLIRCAAELNLDNKYEKENTNISGAKSCHSRAPERQQQPPKSPMLPSFGSLRNHSCVLRNAEVRFLLRPHCTLSERLNNQQRCLEGLQNGYRASELCFLLRWAQLWDTRFSSFIEPTFGALLHGPTKFSLIQKSIPKKPVDRQE